MILYVTEIKGPHDKTWRLQQCHTRLKDAKEYVRLNKESYPYAEFRMARYRREKLYDNDTINK